MLQINKLFHKLLENISGFEISLILLGVLITAPISFLSWNINQSLSLQATNQIDTALVSTDGSKAKPNLSSIITNPNNLEKNLDQIIAASSNLETSPYQNTQLKDSKDKDRWFVFNPKNKQDTDKNNLDFNLSYKLKPSTNLEVRYNKDQERLNFVLPKVVLIINNNEYLIDEAIVATIKNLSADKVIYLADYQGINLSNYQKGKYISFNDMVNGNISIYSKKELKSLLEKSGGKECNVDPVYNNLKEETMGKTSILSPKICLSEIFDYDFKLQSQYLFSFNITSPKFDYSNYILTLSEFINKDFSINSKAVSQTFSKNILVQNTTDFDQIVTVKNPNLKAFQFSVGAIEDWQDLKLSVNSLSLTELSFTGLAKIEHSFGRDLILNRNTIIDLKNGVNEVLPTNSTIKDFKLNTQNTSLTDCELSNFSSKNKDNLINNLNSYSYDSNKIKLNTFCQAFSTNFFADPSFFYNLEMNIIAEKETVISLKTGFISSNDNLNTVILKPGQNEIKLKIDLYNLSDIGAILKVLKSDRISTEITSLTLNKALPKNLDSFIFNQVQSGSKTVPGIIVIDSNNLFSSNFNVKLPKDNSDVKINKMIVKSSSPTSLFTTLKSGDKDSNVQPFTDYYGNQVWLISCSDDCEKVKLSLFTPILIFQKLSLFFFILLTLFYIGCKLFLIQNYTQLSSSLKNILFKFNKFSTKEASKLKTKIIKLENYVLLHKWLIVPLVLAILVCLYFTVGIRITFVFLATVLFLRFKISAKIIAGLVAIGILAMAGVSLISKIPIINNNPSISRYINQGLSENFGIYSYYLIAIAVFIFTLNWYKEQNEETKSA